MATMPTNTSLSLSVDRIDAINAAHESCSRAAKSALLAALECGSLLADAKADIAHGAWQDWPAENCPAIGQSTARMYMQLNAGRDKITQSNDPIETISDARALICETKTLERSVLPDVDEPAPALAPIPKTCHVAHNSGQNEWYTPAEIIERARRTMLVIDLDPASCDAAQQTIKAKKFYSIADDGLSKKWKGRVWLNPPYAKDLCHRFIKKLLESYAANEVVEAIVLVNNATETAWMQPLLRACSAICFPSGRIRFLVQQGITGSPLQGQAVVYLGMAVDDFRKQHEDLGVVFFGGADNE